MFTNINWAWIKPEKGNSKNEVLKIYENIMCINRAENGNIKKKEKNTREYEERMKYRKK